jgi:hypothetical protein
VGDFNLSGARTVIGARSAKKRLSKGFARILVIGLSAILVEYLKE